MFLYLVDSDLLFIVSYCSRTKHTTILIFSTVGWRNRWSDGSGQSQWKAILFQASFVWPPVNLFVARFKPGKLYIRQSPLWFSDLVQILYILWKFVWIFLVCGAYNWGYTQSHYSLSHLQLISLRDYLIAVLNLQFCIH